MPKNILERIKYLCRAITKDEWSGILLYDVEGSIKDPENMVITLKDIFPMDKGTKAHTDYEFNEEFVEYRMDNPESLQWKIGHIHSHNDMRVYFSGEDWEELEDNSPNHNYYLSLIVNNWMDFCAKVSFIGKVNIEDIMFNCPDEEGENYKINYGEISKEVMFVYDCDIETPADKIKVSKGFSERVDTIIEQEDKRKEQAKKNALDNRSSKQPWKQGNFDFQETNDLVGSVMQSASITENFAKFLLRLGDEDAMEEQLETILQHISVSDVKMKDYSQKLVEGFAPLYEKFYKSETDEYPIEIDEIVDEIQEVILVLEEHESAYPFVGDIAKELGLLGLQLEHSLGAQTI